MIKIKLLLVEDNDDDAKNFQRTIKAYKLQKQIQIDCVVAKDIEDFRTKITGNFDAAIIDMKLNNKEAEGYNVLAEIKSSLFRLPCIVLTGTPAPISDEYVLDTFIKGEEQVHNKVLDYLVEVYNTGVTKILGGKGEIEKNLNEIFWNNIKPNLKAWIAHSKISKESTEKSLLRFMGYCMEELINKDQEKSLAEEVYISPGFSGNIRTGTILKKNIDNEYYIVLTPECDLEIRSDGVCNTDIIQLCKIEPFNIACDGLFTKERTSNVQNKIRDYRNNKKNCYHYLPKSSVFDGGLINFRAIFSIHYGCICNEYKFAAKITSPYVKDILARFSSYYARQGQPDFDLARLSDEIVESSI